MKTSQKVATIIIVLIVAALLLIWAGIASKVETPKEDLSQASIKGCYVATIGKDVYTLNILSQNGEKVEGTLSFKNFEKDSSSGTFKGTYKDGILLGDYSFTSEGMDSVMQVIFKKFGDDFM